MRDSRNVMRSWSGMRRSPECASRPSLAPRGEGGRPHPLDSPVASADGRGDLRVERGFHPPRGSRPRAVAVLRSGVRQRAARPVDPRRTSSNPRSPNAMWPARPPRTRNLLAGLLAGTLAAAPGAGAHPRPVEPMDAGEIAHALHRLQTAGSALYVAAHPDDENTALLAWLTHVKGVRTAYLSMTR